MNKTRPIRKDYLWHYSMTTRWRDNDVYAHVNNAVYYEYVDTVVNQWLMRAAGLELPGGPMIGLVVRSECDFFGPLSYPNGVDGGLKAARVGRSSVTYDVGLFAEGEGPAQARALFTHVYVDAQERRPMDLPQAFRAKLAEISEES